jgi:hypothetical protein
VGHLTVPSADPLRLSSVAIRSVIHVTVRVTRPASPALRPRCGRQRGRWRGAGNPHDRGRQEGLQRIGNLPPQSRVQVVQHGHGGDHEHNAGGHEPGGSLLRPEARLPPVMPLPYPSVTPLPGLRSTLQGMCEATEEMAE